MSEVNDFTAEGQAAIAYQICGALNAPTRILDYFSAVASGKKPDNPLPFVPESTDVLCPFCEVAMISQVVPNIFYCDNPKCPAPEYRQARANVLVADPCPKCGAQLESCVAGQYCSSKTCDYAY